MAGIVRNIVHALRRLGSATQKSALRRQDEQLRGQQVLSRQRIRIRDSGSEVEGFVAKIAPVEEKIVPVSVGEVRSILENARLTGAFIRTFHGVQGVDWSLQDLDAAFAAWLHADDKLGYTDAAVVEILGAGFGQYCASHLNMRWIRVTDSLGTAIGLQGRESDFRGFPFHSISKRIPDCEYGFFGSVFISLKHARESEAYRAPILGRSA
jgi:hypothetical protein